MANRFEKATWADRQVQYPSRRRLIATAETDVWDVERIEGEIIEAGKAFGDTNMSNLENRIYNAFETLESSDIKLTDSANLFTATTVDGAFQELFMYAGNGKTAIATAIGSEASPSNTFTQLANTISGGKLQIATALGDSALQTATFAYLAALTAGYRNQALTKKNVAFVHSLIPDSGFTSGDLSHTFSYDMGFTPSGVVVVGVTMVYQVYIGELYQLVPVYSNSFDSYGYGSGIVTGISQTGCTITSKDNIKKRWGADQNVLVIGIE